MAREGFPFILVSLFIAVGFGIFGIWIGVALFVAVAAFMAYFFRDPERTVPTGEGIVVSSADGRVTRVETTDAGTTVSVFLSPLDVHINRSPIAGNVTNINYIKGKKMPATSDAASFENERNTLTIEGSDGTIQCTQIAGILARRIVCRAKVGDNLARGERFGLIKFSSRTDLLLPADAEVLVKVGDRVRGGETIIAKFAARA
ncbi:MAG: phosphatidylserine decarboxylase [Blastocatellia bacterium]|nr:phosphatidylserine decarboxylase [Blastocatellia bacterium]